MLFVEQDKLLPLPGRKRGECRAFRSVDPGGGFCAKLFTVRRQRYQLFAEVVGRGLRLDISLCGKLLYTGIYCLLSQIPKVTQLFLGAGSPKLIDSAENIKGCV